MDLRDRVGIVTGPAKGMGAAITRALAQDGANLLLAGRDTAAIEPLAAEVRESRPPRRRGAVRCHRRSRCRCAAGYGAGRIRRPHRPAGEHCRRLRPAGQTDLGKHPRGVRANHDAERDGVLPDDARGAADDDRATLRQGGECRRHVRPARQSRTGGLQRIEMGAARTDQVGGAGSRAVQRQHQLRLPGHGGRRALRPCALRHGPAAAHHPRRGARPHGRRIRAAPHLHREDVANAVLFLASDRSRQITGQDLAVDGGWVI